MMFIILGLIGLIVNANEWFAVPNVAIYICFGIGILQALSNLAIQNNINHTIRKGF